MGPFSVALSNTKFLPLLLNIFTSPIWVEALYAHCITFVAYSLYIELDRLATLYCVLLPNGNDSLFAECITSPKRFSRYSKSLRSVLFCGTPLRLWIISLIQLRIRCTNPGFCSAIFCIVSIALLSPLSSSLDTNSAMSSFSASARVNLSRMGFDTSSEERYALYIWVMASSIACAFNSVLLPVSLRQKSANTSDANSSSRNLL